MTRLLCIAVTSPAARFLDSDLHRLADDIDRAIAVLRHGACPERTDRLRRLARTLREIAEDEG